MLHHQLNAGIEGELHQNSGGAPCGSADRAHIGHRRFVQQQTGNHKHQVDGIDGDVETPIILDDLEKENILQNIDILKNVMEKTQKYLR